MSASVELPPWVEGKLKEYSSKFRVDQETLKSMLLELYNKPFVQSDPQFKNDDMRFAYCLDVLYARLVQQKTVREYVVIPFGATDVRQTKQGPQSRLYALVFIDNRRVNSVILFRGQLADMVKDVQLYYAYRTRLMRSPAGDNVFFATTFTEFKNPQPIPQGVPEFIEKVLGVRRVTIAESAQSLSRKIDKFVDEFDLRLVEGVVLRCMTGKRPSGSEWAFYVITDGSLDDDRIMPDGTVIPSQFTVWVPHFMAKYAEDSKLLFLGTLTTTSSREVQMNAIYVHPVISVPLMR